MQSFNMKMSRSLTYTHLCHWRNVGFLWLFECFYHFPEANLLRNYSKLLVHLPSVLKWLYVHYIMANNVTIYFSAISFHPYSYPSQKKNIPVFQWWINSLIALCFLIAVFLCDIRSKRINWVRLAKVCCLKHESTLYYHSLKHQKWRVAVILYCIVILDQ